MRSSKNYFRYLSQASYEFSTGKLRHLNVQEDHIYNIIVQVDGGINGIPELTLKCKHRYLFHVPAYHITGHWLVIHDDAGGSGMVGISHKQEFGWVRLSYGLHPAVEPA